MPLLIGQGCVCQWHWPISGKGRLNKAYIHPSQLITVRHRLFHGMGTNAFLSTFNITVSLKLQVIEWPLVNILQFSVCRVWCHCTGSVWHRKDGHVCHLHSAAGWCGAEGYTSNGAGSYQRAGPTGEKHYSFRFAIAHRFCLCLLCLQMKKCGKFKHVPYQLGKAVSASDAKSDIS